MVLLQNITFALIDGNRTLALEKGYTLNEYELSKINPDTGEKESSLFVESEKDIFDKLGLEYRLPKERDL